MSDLEHATGEAVAARTFKAAHVGIGAALGLMAIGMSAGISWGYLQRTYETKAHVAELKKEAEATHNAGVEATTALNLEFVEFRAEMRSESKATRSDVERVSRQVDEIAKVTGARRVPVLRRKED